VAGFIFLPSIFLPVSARDFDYVPSLLMSTVGYKLVQLVSGDYSIHSLAHDETFHPVIGPVAEAEALYVNQLRLRRRLKNHSGEFVIWKRRNGSVLTRFGPMDLCSWDSYNHCVS